MTEVTPPPAPQSTPPAAPQSTPHPYAAAAAPNPYASAATGPRTNTLAIISLVLAFFISLGAVICGHIALSQIKKTGENGRGLALAGLVLGYIGLVVGFLAVIFAVVFPFLLIGTTGSFDM